MASDAVYNSIDTRLSMVIDIDHCKAASENIKVEYDACNKIHVRRLLVTNETRSARQSIELNGQRPCF